MREGGGFVTYALEAIVSPLGLLARKVSQTVVLALRIIVTAVEGYIIAELVHRRSANLSGDKEKLTYHGRLGAA